MDVECAHEAAGQGEPPGRGTGIQTSKKRRRMVDASTMTVTVTRDASPKRGRWSKRDEYLLIQSVKAYGEGAWDAMSREVFIGRNSTQLRCKWEKLQRNPDYLAELLDSGGGSICEHGRQRSKCRECDGGAICEHGRIRTQCKECGGSEICEHNRIRSTCKECGGGSICEHNRIRSSCKECGGGSICEHGRRRTRCKECGGGSICEHGRRRSRCNECGASEAAAVLATL